MNGWRQGVVGGVLALLVGCASQPADMAVPAPEPAAPPPPVRPAPVTKAPAPPVLVVISSNIPAYTDIAEQLQRRLGSRAKRLLLDESAPVARKPAGSAGTTPPEPVVAIGLEAALWARPLQQAGRPVVFCQVFNYLENDLSGERMKGVSFLPPPEQTFATWRALAPAVKRVAVYTGPGLEAMLAPAVRAAARHGITLVHATVNSDKDFLYSYKRSAAEVDGLWLLPDNRILSRTAIQDVMSYSVRNGKQVVVFSEQLLQLGGLFSATSEADDIAMKVIERLGKVGDEGAVEGPTVLELERTSLHINSVIAQRFNLSVPPQLSRHVIR